MSRKSGWFRFSSITTKIIVVNILLLLICTMGMGIFSFTTFQNDNVLISVERALDVAETIAVFIDGDNFAETIASGDENAIALHGKELADRIFEVANISSVDITSVYILGADYDENITYYVKVDNQNATSELYGTDRVIDYASAMFQTIKTGESSTTELYDSDDHGMMVSGFAAVRDTSGNIVGVVGADISLEDVFATSRLLEFMYRLSIIVILCSIVPILFQIFLFRHIIGRPIKELIAACAKIGNGDLDIALSIHTGDEIEELSNTLTKMTAQLKNYIVNLTEATAEKERIGAELSIATQIQTSMLPCVSSLLPYRDDFDIYAIMQPAKEVGGDFYDFFFVDEQTLGVVIADVSGKGIPAALFMVISKILIKSNAQYGKSPKEVFETVNNVLCENNNTGMFVTAFLGYLDIPSGTFTFVNAGHNPPLFHSGKHVDWLKMKSGFVLAGMKDIMYTQGEITLQPGDELFLYTDGVTEAMNFENELFGSLRLLKTVHKHLDLPLQEIIESIKYEIDEFSSGMEQADDITMLVLRYHCYENEKNV